MQIVYSTDINLINKNFLKDYKDFIFINFNDNLSYIEDLIINPSLFTNNNSYIINNCTFLENISDNYFNFLKKIIDKNIVLILNSKKIDSKINLLLDSNKIIYIQSLNSYTYKKYIDDILGSKRINNVDKCFLQSLLIPDSLIIENEINKIFLLGEDNNDKWLLGKIIFDYNKENIFELVINFLDKKYIDLFKILDNLIFKGYTVENIISVISSQLLSLKIYIEIYEKEKKIDSIINTLDINEYKIKIFFNIIKSINSFKINSMLNKLLDLEINIKNNNYESYLAIKNFFLRF